MKSFKILSGLMIASVLTLSVSGCAPTATYNTQCSNTIDDPKNKPSSYIQEVKFTNSQNLTAGNISCSLAHVNIVAIRSADGHWAPDIYLPASQNFQGKSILVDHQATYDTSVYYDRSIIRMHKGNKIILISDGNSWQLIN